MTIVEKRYEVIYRGMNNKSQSNHATIKKRLIKITDSMYTPGDLNLSIS
jgi:hypothetical protein